MNLKEKVTIVIPCKNEEKYIERTIISIVKQSNIKGVHVIIADANSTDKTRDIIKKSAETFKDILNIELIDGGPVGYARNHGCELVSTKYVLFIDADVVLMDNNLINDTIFQMYHYKLDLLTCKSTSYGNDLRTLLSFKIFNFINGILSIKIPFAIGTYFLTKRDKFRELGGFDETIKHSEDFCLSKKYNPKKFKISNHYIGQDDRRFQKTGYIGMTKLLIKGFFNRNNNNFFKEDIDYWN